MSNVECLKVLLQKTKGYPVLRVLDAFLFNNSRGTANNYELATFIKYVLIKLPDLVFPLFQEEDVALSSLLHPRSAKCSPPSPRTGPCTTSSCCCSATPRSARPSRQTPKRPSWTRTRTRRTTSPTTSTAATT